MSKLRLEGKVALITGAARGIGEATARLFASHGAFVIVTDIQDELGLSVVQSISPEKSTYMHCDVRDETQVEAVVEHAVQTYGRLDVMVSNAGVIGGMESVTELKMDEFDGIMAVNVRGGAAAIKHAARAMVVRGVCGSIVCTASVLSLVGVTGLAAYAVSKHALLGLVRAAAAELGGHGIRVNCVSPALVATPMTCALFGESPEAAEERFAAALSLKGTVLRAGNVAEAVLFLASDESEFISGHNLVVDGGRTAVLWEPEQLNK